MAKKYWAKDNLNKWRLYYEFKTGGLSDNERLIKNLPEFVKLICELKWQRGGYHVYDLSPYNFSYKTVSEKHKN